MKVPFIDLKTRFIEEKEELLSAVKKTLSSGSLVMTKELEEFEHEVQLYTKSKYLSPDLTSIFFNKKMQKMQRFWIHNYYIMLFWHKKVFF